MANIALISLGCAKNQVNSEEMLHQLDRAGHKTVDLASNADVAIVNTCGFIDAATEEAIAHILELGKIKAAGKLRKIIVTGCLAQRHGREMLVEMPEVDGVLGTGSYDEIVSAIEQVMNSERVAIFGDIDAPLVQKARAVEIESGWAYLKIAEGCDNCCAYCVIPSLRGKFRSRPIEGLIEEAQILAKQGVRELILVAQDTTRYGEDLYGKRRLADLLCNLAQIPELDWIRIHYLYPDGIDDALITAIRDTDKVLRYLDIPIQHSCDKILQAMSRRYTGAEICTLFARLRKELPGLVLRTSLIAGLPGEGEGELEELAAFLTSAQIERVGVFPYSPQDGTTAAEMPNRPSWEEAEQRVERLMQIQARVMEQFNQRRIGKVDTVLCTGYDTERAQYYGRSFAESPEVDGVIWLNTDRSLSLGQLYTLRYIGEIDGEMIGDIE